MGRHRRDPDTTTPIRQVDDDTARIQVLHTEAHTQPIYHPYAHINRPTPRPAGRRAVSFILGIGIAVAAVGLIIAVVLLAA